jgi:hypothetical protein
VLSRHSINIGLVFNKLLMVAADGAVRNAQCLPLSSAPYGAVPVPHHRGDISLATVLQSHFLFDAVHTVCTGGLFAGVCWCATGGVRHLHHCRHSVYLQADPTF